MDAFKKYQDFMVSMQDHVELLCQDLIQNTPIKNVDFVRFYDDGYCLKLTNNPDACYACFENQLFFTCDDLHALYNSGKQMHILSEAIPLKKEEININARKWKESINLYNQFNSHHRLYFLSRHSDYFKYYLFSTSSTEEQNIFDFYLNKITLLKAFMIDFETKADQLFRLAPKKGIYIPSYRSKQPKKQITKPTPSFSITKEIKPTRLTVNNRLVTLSKREIQCLLLRLYHYSSKMISQSLPIEPSVVNHYIATAKQKLGVTKMYLIKQIFEENGFLPQSHLMI